jgi:site-specific recombinase XerD
LAALERLPRRGEFVFAKRSGVRLAFVRRSFNSACTRAGLIDVTPHTLRHTFAARLVENGVDLRTVQELGGWATLSLVQRYAHVSPSRKVEAVEGLVRNTFTTGFTPVQNTPLASLA